MPNITPRQAPLIATMLTAISLATPPANAREPETPPPPDLPLGAEHDTVIIVHLGPSPVVDVKGLLHEVTDGPLIIETRASETVDLWFVQGEGDTATVFVSQDDEPSGQLELHGNLVRYTTSPGVHHGFEVALPGQEAPTRPTLVVVPIEDGPTP